MIVLENLNERRKVDNSLPCRNAGKKIPICRVPSIQRSNIFDIMQCQALLHQLIVLLLRTSSRSNLPYLIPSQQSAIEKALHIFHTRTQDNIRVRDVAAEVGFSSQHFRELFKRYVGVSPKQYLTTLI